MVLAKKLWFPDGNSAGFAPNYESEGSGSSGRLDTELTEGAPGRKCINLNAASHDSFGVPIRVLPISKLSSYERKDLVHRLSAELEQIRVLQKRVNFPRGNVATVSSSSDILSCSNVQSAPPARNTKKSSALTSGAGKKLNPPAHKGRGWNRGTSGRFESANQASEPSSSNALLLKQCENMLKKLMLHQYAWVFNKPVDIVELNIPDYFTIIKHPMDLGTVKNNIASSQYSCPLDFVSDVRLTFSNAMTYNPPGSDVHIMADSLSKIFEHRWKTLAKKIPVNDGQSLSRKQILNEETKTTEPMLPSKKRKFAPKHHKPIMEPVKRIMSDAEKQNLSRELEAVLGELPDNIVEFLREQSTCGKEAGEDEIEVDIDDLGDDTLFTLRGLLDDFLQRKQNDHGTSEPCEIELLNQSELSNSSMQLYRGNDPTDEEVDVGGNEPLLSGYPPVEIQKDTVRSEKFTSAGSSHSNSDSDSSSYSDRELDGAGTCPPGKIPDENFNPGADLDEKGNAEDLIDGNQSVSGLDQLEQSSQQKLSSVDSDLNQDGESAPNERQVSPDKQYRVAILKNRFLDTILKAREKTLNQGEKVDPEKLRHQKEELELQKRKEKARLQAEAKAAEDARSKAEAEAIAEAKRKRELEREAARQALMKMEKTVEINENSRFLEDLEMLSAVPAEQLPSSVDETSPDHSQDGLGSFKFGGSNPLEQLGLYMKIDDDEEEGEPAASVPNAVDDVEEGEID